MDAMSAKARTQHLQEMQEVHWDLVIIGGGITGAGILLDAASRGLRVLLLEKHDFAWGTSSRSTKLIHGGLRYLKQMEIGLVREVGKERAIVYQNARHIVRPEKMLLPIIKDGSLGKASSSIGLWVYDWLADVNEEEKRKMLSKEETLRAEPRLNRDILVGGGMYYEYRTDDARLTIEIIKKAAEFGGRALNYCEVTGFSYENGKISGVHIRDTPNGRTFSIASKCVVNATGPWVDQVRKLDEDVLRGKTLRLTKGVHLVIPREKLDLNQSVYFDVPGDGRMIFCIPRDEVVYMGTTDTDYTDSIDDPGINGRDVAYILKAVNRMFPDANLMDDDVISTWAGLRPLIHEEGKSPSELSRKDEIFISKTGLISIAGGKLTGYRKMASRIIKEIRKRNEQYKIGRAIGKSQTKEIRVAGNVFGSEQEMDAFRKGLQADYPAFHEQAKPLFEKYGANTRLILSSAKEVMEHRDIPQKDAAHYAEIKYGIEHEMVRTLSDFCIRRTGMLYFEPTRMSRELEKFAGVMQEILGWDHPRKAKEIQNVRTAYNSVMAFS